MEATERHATTFDGATVAAAVATLAFAVLAGVLLANVPQAGQLGGAIESIKNVVYVLTVPFFDIARRLFASRGNAATPGSVPAAPNLLTIAFVSALVLFIVIEAISVLVGAGVGGFCQVLGQNGLTIDFGLCLLTGFNAMGTAVIGPLMVALGLACGWMWQRLVGDGFWRAFILFTVAITLLFGLDYLFFLQNPLAKTQSVQDAMVNWGPVQQIGLQLIVLLPSVLIGYGVRRLWTAVAGAVS